MTTVSTLHHVRLDAADTRTLASGAAAAVQQAAIFRIEGPGAVGCLQGIVSNDVQKRGPGTICYGAVLTPKGMIIFDCWLLRDGDTIVLVADLSVRQTALDIFRRQLPPRIAKAADLSDSHRWLTVLGATARQTGIDAGMPATPGQLTRSADEVLLAQAPLTAPFGCCAVGETAAINELAATMPAASPGIAAAARIIAGFPALGAEIDEKTLPQEVRFDEHAGVSYDKGCYTGQETVARVHFRGHPNRELRLLVVPDGVTLDTTALEVVHDDKTVGTIRSLVETPQGSFALAPLRREVPLGAVVSTLGGSAVVGVPPALL